MPERDLHPLPIDVVRDLLGIARAAYAVHLRKGNRGIAARLKRAGEDLRRALALAVKDGGPVANERAWYLASSAAQVIARETCMGRETLGHAVEVTAQRMRSRAQQSVIDSRTARRERRIKRG
ncbi:MAG TPA: hypothetical protein VFK05_07110 [Polyangiaceae bacterium]|nr:hypothetical protein [Polyangiaceae bacterium]